MKIPDDVAEMLKKKTSIKMIGTVDENQNINLERLNIIKITDSDTIIIPYFTKNNKTFENLQKNKKFSMGLYLLPGIVGFKLNGLLNGLKDSEKYLKYFSEFYNRDKLAGAISIRITEIYALTMVIAGDKIA